MEELEEAKKKREADPQYLLGPMYRDYGGNGYNYDNIQSTLGKPYYRDTPPPYYYNQRYSPIYNDDDAMMHDEGQLNDGGRNFFIWLTRYFYFYILNQIEWQEITCYV